MRSMPAADSANIRPMNSRPARSRLAAILRIDRLAPAPRSSRASSAAEIHSTMTSATTADNMPSIRLRRLISLSPTFQLHLVQLVQQQRQHAGDPQHQRDPDQPRHAALDDAHRSATRGAPRAARAPSPGRPPATAAPARSDGMPPAAARAPAPAAPAAPAAAPAPGTARRRRCGARTRPMPRARLGPAHGRDQGPGQREAAGEDRQLDQRGARQQRARRRRPARRPSTGGFTQSGAQALRRRPARADARPRCAPARSACSRLPGRTRCGPGRGARPASSRRRVIHS